MNKVNHSQDLTNKSILIVEDDKFNAIIIASFLEKTQAKCQIATTGEMGIEMAQTLKPDVILMDIKLPNISGLDATREIRKFLPDVIIIAQTAYGTESDREIAIEAGCNDFITKPIRYEKLIYTIRKFIE